MYREARARLGDPVAAWAEVVSDLGRRRRYQSVRDRGGLVRIGWDEATEIIAAAHVHTIATYGPDRIAGFTPIPAFSMASYAVGSRFISLIGGAMLSFYDWYADLPVASPQVFGDQTDVPESAGWWDAAYLMLWGSNVPVTRTPDAHYMAEARYRGQKVVVLSPDYSDAAKFADEWLAPVPGTDGALAISSELYERRLLRVASPLFHFGILIVLIGHIVGLLIPQSWTAAIGLSENAYHFLAVALGTVAGACTLIGIALLIYRRRTIGPVFLATTRNDKLTYVVLTLTILLGLTATVDANEELSGAAGLAGYRTLGASFDGPVVCVATSGGFKDAGVGADDADETVTVDGSWESARPYLGVPDA